MENGMLTGVLFLDLKKAFDTVDHSIMLKKNREQYGLDMNSVQWFLQYPSNCTQCTKVNNVLWDTRTVCCGVPQGSILGPLMFILYINSIDTVVTDCSISLYADDTTLYYANSLYIDLMLTVRDEAGSIAEWLNLTKLTLNTKKTKFMVFGR